MRVAKINCDCGHSDDEVYCSVCWMDAETKLDSAYRQIQDLETDLDNARQTVRDLQNTRENQIDHAK